ncbi:hypothetical protein [Hominiventricola aquisgranensis]|uniref:Uncharacterized protein n=1 Tax=Hominiventricola aquisgranensis TaxID=3133164 RepID=A0ABV1I0E4_9FIRM
MFEKKATSTDGFSRFVGNFTAGTNIPIMKAAKELQTFKNTAEKKLPDKDIEEFH